MKVFLLVFVTATLSTMIHTLFMAVVGWILGAKVEVVSLFSGPKLLSVERAGIDFRISLLPLGSYVRFYGDGPESGAPAVTRFQDLNPIKRVLTAASGSLALLLCAANLIGLSQIPHSFIKGFQQFFAGGVMPLSQGQQLLHQLSEMARSGPFPLLFGLIAVKMAAFNLLPFPTLNGGYIIREIIRLAIAIPEKVFNLVGLLAMAAAICGWMIAIVYYLVH